MFMGKSAANVRRVLVVRPAGFFSSRYRLEVEEQDENGRPFHHDREEGDPMAFAHAVGILLFIAFATLIGWLTG